MAFSDYDFKQHQGVTPSAHAALHKRFSSWEQIAKTPPEQIMEVRGITDKIALDLIDTANVIAERERRKAAANAVERPMSHGVGARRFILSGKPADFAGPDGAGRVTNVKRRRKLITPAVCDECGLDFVDKLGLGDYDQLSSATQDDLRRRVKAHKDMLHGTENKLILTEDELRGIKGDANPKAKAENKRAKAALAAKADLAEAEA